MYSRRSPHALFPGVGLLVVGLVLLSACASSEGSDVAAQAPAAAGVSPGTAASATTAVLPARKASASTRASASRGAGKSAGAGPMDAASAAASAPSAGSAVISGASSVGTVYGISDPALLSVSPSGQVQQLEAMKAMGITSVRVEASWNVGQASGPGSFDFALLDQVVASLQAVGISADLDIDQTPSWAAVSGEQGNEWAQPASASAFGTWAGAVAARYANSGVVKYFEIWNEENTAAFWLPKPDPAAYTADLQAAYAAIKKADPSAVVISGGLAPATDSSTTDNALTFVNDMYADGARGSFDGLGYHPYSYPATPDEIESWSGWSQMSDTSSSLRSVMAANGDSGKKIWITEYGAPTSGPNSVGESGQSTDLVQAISQVKSVSWVGSFYIYTWADLSSLSATEDGFGLLADDNAQKQAYSAVTAALTGT